MSEKLFKPQKTIIISSMMQKGGVGKTTLLSILTYSLADMGYKILCIDADEQRNFSTSFGLSPNPEKNLYKAFVNDEDISNHIVITDYSNIDFVIADSNLRDLNEQMYSMPFKEQRFKSILNNITNKKIYDFILIDTHPSLGSFNTSILYTTDEILIPIEPAGFTVDGLIDFVNFYNEAKKYNATLNILGIIYNRIDNTQNISKDIIDVINEFFNNLVFNTRINDNTNIKTAQAKRIPIPKYISKMRKTKQSTRSLDQFKAFTKEVIDIVSTR